MGKIGSAARAKLELMGDDAIGSVRVAKKMNSASCISMSGNKKSWQHVEFPERSPTSVLIAP